MTEHLLVLSLFTNTITYPGSHTLPLPREEHLYSYKSTIHFAHLTYRFLLLVPFVGVRPGMGFVIRFEVHLCLPPLLQEKKKEIKKKLLCLPLALFLGKLLSNEAQRVVELSSKVVLIILGMLFR
jgi:hypothetical protein